MKTLFITPQIPWPLDVGSKIRINSFLRCYAQMGEVTLVCFAQDEAEEEIILELEHYCYRLFCFPIKAKQLSGPPPSPSRCEILLRAIDPQPKIVRYFGCYELAHQVESLLENKDFDILHVARLSMTHNVLPIISRLPRSHRPYCVLDIDDIESTKMSRMAALEPWAAPRKYLLLIEQLKLKIYEWRVLRQFDYVLVCSEKDRRQIQEGRQSPKIEVFCNGAEIEDWAEPVGHQDNSRTLVFLGAMNYQPNEDAVLFFTASVLPLIRQKIPDVKFIIAGKSPSPRVRAIHNSNDILVTGYVENKAALFASCSVFVVPIRLGGGTRIKILEALAAGKAVVSTSVGCEGIDVTSGKNIMIADTPEELSNACVNLIRDEPMRLTLGRAGRELILQNYSWHEIRSRFVTNIKDQIRLAHQTTNNTLTTKRNN